MPTDSLPPPPPAHLSPEAATWWRSVMKDYSLEPHHLKILQIACETWDRHQQARSDIAAYGSLSVPTADGGLKLHPAVAVERDSRIAFARLVRELDLDAGAPSESKRPPALYSNRRD